MNSFIIIGAGILQIPMAEEVKAMGMQALMTDGDPDAPGQNVADEFAIADTYDLNATMKVVRAWHWRGHNIVGVATCGADVAPTVAAVANEFGLCGISPEIAMLTHNKASVRILLGTRCLSQYQPEWAVLNMMNLDYLTILEKKIKQWGGLVVKPLEARASRGLTICRSMQDIFKAVENLRKYINAGSISGNVTKTFLIEQILTGTEHSAEIIYQEDGRPVFFNIVDRKFRYDDGIAMELGHVSPSTLPKEAWEKVRTMVEMAAKACGVSFGPFKCDVIYTDDGPKILECTARLSGGFDCQETVKYSGRNPIKQVIEIALGENRDVRPNKPFLNLDPGSYLWDYGACAAAFPRTGRIIKIDDSFPMCLNMPNVRKIHVLCKVGDVIENYQHCAQRPAFVITSAPSADVAWKAARLASSVLADKIITELV